MRSVERLTRSPRAFREHERAQAAAAVTKIVDDDRAAIARREPWAVWLLEAWRPYRLGEISRAEFEARSR